MEKFKFRKNFDLGSLAAEDDRYLEESFVKKIELNLLKDIKNPRSIVLGRTGTGKTALLMKIEEEQEHVLRINPEELSLKFLSNSSILDYFRTLDVNLDLFYKVLWKHVFIVELLKVYFKIGDIKNQNWLQEMINKYTPNKKKKKAVEYLEQWEDSFWEKTEYRVKDIESKLMSSMASELGLDVDVFRNKLTNKEIFQDLKEEKTRTEVIHKAEKVVDEVQIREIYDIIEIMRTDLFNDPQKKYYIIIDDLDKDWVDKKIVYDLLKNLIVVINEFNQMNSCKIIIALRDNLMEIISNFGNSRGMQREKYESLYLKIEWNESELKDLINNRLKVIMKGAFSGDSPTVDDILPKSKKKRGMVGFDYMIERSFLRPRDIISFFNKCISLSNGKTNISTETIRKAEQLYSQSRLHSIEDEWRENFGEVRYLYKFLRDKANGFKIKDLNEEDFQDFRECKEFCVND